MVKEYISSDVWTADIPVLGIIEDGVNTLKVCCDINECKDMFLDFIDGAADKSRIEIDIRLINTEGYNGILNISNDEIIADGADFEDIADEFTAALGIADTDEDFDEYELDDEDWPDVLDDEE